MNLPRLARTLRYLKFVQIQGLLRHRLGQKFSDPRRLLRSIPEDGQSAQIRWSPGDHWLHADGTPNGRAEILTGHLHFVGQSFELGYPPNWQPTECSLLWQYHLHYHSFLANLSFAEAKQVIEDYLQMQPPRRGAVGWQSYPLSLRIQTWVSLFFGRWQTQTLAEKEFCARLWLELRRMMHWLQKNLERHLQANHLLENAIAICLAGACFDGELAASWRRQGYALLRSELQEQILPDGGHYERSPMYQQRVLFALGILMQSNDPELLQICRQPAQKMASWLQTMTHPDGGIALYNDSALGTYPSPQELSDWLADMQVVRSPLNPPDSVAHLVDSGYFSARNAAGDACFMDIGQIGPPHQPGHTHADFLSLEVSIAGLRLVVDGGNFDYLESPQRAWARSVRAHNTVFVAEHEPLELWGAFRIGRRAKPQDVQVELAAQVGSSCSASHDGYRHLRGAPKPNRKATWQPTGLLHLQDSVVSSVPHECLSQLRIDGAWQMEQPQDDRLHFNQKGIDCWILCSRPIELSKCHWFPGFGRESPAHLLQVKFLAEPTPTPVHWLICPASERTAGLQLLDQLRDGPA
jgi:uncharacterized heparinase superfamily protein